jgi:integrase
MKDGRWRAEIVVDGKKKPVYGKTEQEANRKLRDMQNDADNGVLVMGKVPTLEQWLDYWFENILSVDGKPHTLANTESKIRLHVRGTRAAKTKLDKLTPELIESIYTAMRTRKPKPLSETTVLQVHRILSSALNVAVQRGRLGTNPVSRIKTPRAAKFKPEILSPDDARALIAAADGKRNGVRWMIGLTLGLRQGETLGLGWDQIDFDAGTLAVSRELMRVKYKHGCDDIDACNKWNHCTPTGCQRKQRRQDEKPRVFRTDRKPRKADHWNACPNPCPPDCKGHASHCPQRIGGLWIGTPKSDAGDRVVALPGFLVDALKQHRAEQDAELAAAGRDREPWISGNGEPVDLVFRNANQDPIDSKRDWDAWKAFLADAGVAEVRVHDQRHTAATVLLLMGVDGRVVMDILGWSQSSMLKRYQHVIDEMKRGAADAMHTAFWAPQPAPEPQPEPETNVVSFDQFRRRRSS